MSVYQSLPCRLLWVDLPCSNLLHRDQLGEESRRANSAPYSSYRLQSSSSGLSGGACAACGNGGGGGSGADSEEAQQVIDSRGILD